MGLKRRSCLNCLHYRICALAFPDAVAARFFGGHEALAAACRCYLRFQDVPGENTPSTPPGWLRWLTGTREPPALPPAKVSSKEEREAVRQRQDELEHTLWLREQNEMWKVPRDG